MNSKVKREYDTLVKLGFSNEVAFLMAKNKYNQLDEETEQILSNLKDETQELANAIKEYGFVKFSDNIIPEASEK